jgi:hypothetical protein
MSHLFLFLPLLLAVGCGREDVVHTPTESPARLTEEASAELVRIEQDVQRQARIRSAHMVMDEAVKGFRLIHKRYPESLDEVVQKGMLKSLPDLPPGERFLYNRETGAVELAQP